MFNKVIIVGNLTRDVELKYLPSGSALATLGLASNRRYKKQDGSMGDEVCFIDVKLFGRSAEVANQYLRKGSKVLIEGRLTLENWTDQMGSKKSRHTISAESMQMMDSKPNTSQDESYHIQESNARTPQEMSSHTRYPKENINSQKYESNIPEINTTNAANTQVQDIDQSNQIKQGPSPNQHQNIINDSQAIDMVDLSEDIPF